MIDILSAFGSQIGSAMLSAPEMARATPSSMPADNDTRLKLHKAGNQRAGKVIQTAYVPVTPAPNNTPKNVYDNFQKLRRGELASHQRNEDRVRLGAPPITDKDNVILYNPNSDRSFLAHEMGHAVSANTPHGKAIRNIRSNPKLMTALGLAGFLGGTATSALTPGDEDKAAAIGLAYAANAPVLIDEFLATKNGLGIMKDAGMPATLGQRGRLAGAYLTYLTAPLLGAMIANGAGNLIDENTV